MGNRERVLASLNHRQPDKIPYDILDRFVLVNFSFTLFERAWTLAGMESRRTSRR